MTVSREYQEIRGNSMEEEAPAATHTGRPVRHGCPATGRTWTCRCPPSFGPSETTPRPTATSVARQYVDEAESGRVADRPQFREMIEEGSQPKAPFRGHPRLEVLQFSRFTRKREHAVVVQVHAPAQGHQGGVHHRAGRRHPHRQAALRESSSPWTSSTARTWRRRSSGA